MWEEVINWISTNKVTFFSSLVSVGSVLFAARANKISKEANKIAEKAIKQSKFAKFSEYYNHLYNIKDILSEILEYMDYDISRAADLMSVLFGEVKRLSRNMPEFPLPPGSEVVFKEIRDDCYKINKEIGYLYSVAVSFNDDFNHENDEKLLKHDKEKLSEDTQTEYDKTAKDIKKSIEVLREQITTSIEES